MSKKQKQRRKMGKKEATPLGETQASVSITVAWSLTVVAMLVGEVCTAVLWALQRFIYTESETMKAAFSLALLGCCILAVLTLVLLPIVKKVRQTPPPRGFTLGAILLAALPLCGLMLTML